MEIFKEIITKLLLVVIPVVIGTGVFGYLNYLRTRRDTIRHKSVEFLDEVSIVINKPLSMLFGSIRAQKTKLDDEVNKAISDVFMKRLSVRVKS